MATKTNLSKTVRENLPFIIASNGGSMNKKELRDTYVIHEGCDSEYDFGSINNKSRWSRLRSAIHSQCPKLIKMGILYQPSKGKFDLVQGASIASSFVPFLNGQSAPVVSAPVVVEPVVEETVEVEPVVEPMVEPVVEVSVANPAVIEAHIDTETQELVENVGGSQDWRKPLDEVEDGYITSTLPSSVQVSTTTLEPVVEVEETEPVVEVEETQEEVEFVEAPVEPVEAQEVVEPTLEVEMPVEDDMEVEEEKVDEQPSYDIKALRRRASFDPWEKALKGGKITGRYEVYRDQDARNIVLTQKGREDYVVIPVDVDIDSLREIEPKYAKFAEMAISNFNDQIHHKDGCHLICKALLSCVNKCQHTDDFGGFVEDCLNPFCPLQNIWGGVSIYVNPQDA